VRLAQALLQKPKAPKAPTAEDTEAPCTNPFLPPDPALFVAESGNENLVLNKYCVSPYHLLIVTKEYEPQGALLLPSEFQTACWVFEQMPQRYLLFYNAGPLSGASQPHKHLQLLPSDDPDAAYPPVFAALSSWAPEQNGQIDTLPFLHHCVRLDATRLTGADHALADRAEYLHRHYQGLMAAVSKDLLRVVAPTGPLDSSGSQSWDQVSYSFICTVDMMLIAPRRAEKWGTLSINSLGLAGMILAKSESELEVIEEQGVVDVLAHIGFPRVPTDAAAVDLSDDTVPHVRLRC
ncbi:bifunctional AP-4-A phosphorylase/ADP sulfurylase, partial [Dimargaris xerosporica]